jgi:hypothetical protein
MLATISRTLPARALYPGIAAIALAATGALAQPQGKGNGADGAPGNAAHGNGAHAGGNGGADRALTARGNQTGNAGSGKPDKAQAAPAAAPQRNIAAAPANGPVNSPVNGKAANGGGNRDGRSNETARENDPDRRADALDRKGRTNGTAKADIARSGMRGNGNGDVRGNARQAAPIKYGRERAGIIFARNDRSIRDRGLLDGCPPGLAKKANGCTPPGLERRDPYRYDDAGWWGLPGLNDGRYRYYGGNLVSLSDAGSILGYYPLLGGALSVGNMWPEWYDAGPLPRYTQDFYSLGPSYRYADNVVYRTDPDNSAITSIAALLTGDDFQVGQRMPSGYDIYNVPYGYRDQYRDGPDARYRYSDGYVYQVDPTSQLIVAAIELLT